MIAVDTRKQSESRSASIENSRIRKWLPSLLWLASAVLLLISTAFPYWGLVLNAPQYPGGLQMRVFVNYMTGDSDPRLDEVKEIDGLNHYIGMKSLYEAASFERSIAVPAVIIMLILLVVAAFWRRRWTWLLTVPALVFPFVYLADLAFWMNYYGQNLDPSAPLSSAIKPFTPPILGEGVIGQFKTISSVNTGWIIAVIGSACILVGIMVTWLNRRSQAA